MTEKRVPLFERLPEIYRIKDARTAAMLRLAREIIGSRLAEGQALLDELTHEAPNESRR